MISNQPRKTDKAYNGGHPEPFALLKERINLPIKPCLLVGYGPRASSHCFVKRNAPAATSRENHLLRPEHPQTNHVSIGLYSLFDELSVKLPYLLCCMASNPRAYAFLFILIPTMSGNKVFTKQNTKHFTILFLTLNLSTHSSNFPISFADRRNSARYENK